MAKCVQCGDDITNKFLTDYCRKCIERAMDNLTADDIKAAMDDLAKRGEAVSTTKPDGSRQRVDPVDFRNTDEA